MLRVEVISQLSPTDRLIEEWSDLAQSCPYATVFQTAEWLTTWWFAIGQKSRRKRLHLLAVRDGKALVGLLALMYSNWHSLPIRRLTLLAAGSIDYGDAIALPGLEAEVCEALYRFLGQQSNWGILDLRELRDGGLLRQYPPAPTTGFVYSDYPLEVCPYLDIPSDIPLEERWPKLKSGLTKKMRGNIGYYQRTLAKTFQVEERVVDSEADISDAFDALFELHRRRWNRRWLPGVFNSKAVRIFHVSVAKRLLQQGWLRLHLLILDGEIQAALYAFAFHDRTCYYQGGFEPELARYSLGSVLIANALETASAQGFATFDFLRGNEEYKQRWTQGEHKTNIRRFITRSGAQLAWAERIHYLEYNIEKRIKAAFAGGIVRKPVSIASTGMEQS